MSRQGGMETMEELKENTVQQTLCMPLWGGR